MPFNWKAVRPHLLAVLSFLVLSIAYNAPQLEGKKLVQHDMAQVHGMSQELKEYEKQTGEHALWTNALFGGMPAYQVYLSKPSILVKHLSNLLTKAIPQPASLFFILMLGFYVLMMVLGLSPLMAAIFSIAYGFSTYNFIIVDVGHITKAMAMAYMAPCLAGLIMMFRGQLLAGFLLFLLSLTLEIYSYHYQISYYLAIVIIIYGAFTLVETIKSGRWENFSKTVGLALFAAVIAIGASWTNINLTYQYSADSMRGSSVVADEDGEKKEGLDKDYAFNWSYGIGETFTMLIPNFKGGASGGIDRKYLDDVDPNYRQAMQQTNAYFGNQPGVAGPTYFGALLVFLAILGLFLIQGNIKWWLLLASVLFTMLAWGDNFKPLSYFFFDYFPLYNKFRAVSMMLVIPALCFPIIAALAVKALSSADLEKAKALRFLYIAFGLTGGLSLLMYLMPDVFNNFITNYEAGFLDNARKGDPANVQQVAAYEEAIVTARKAIFREDALRSFVVILIGAALVWLNLREKLKGQYLLLGLGIVMLIDLWTVGKRYLNEDDFVRARSVEQPFVASPADLQILQDPGHFRVLDMTENSYNSNRASYFHQSLGGYHPAKLGRFEDVKVRYLVDSNERPIATNIGILGMFNTKYIISNGQSGPQANLNPSALGPAWFINQVKTVSDHRQELVQTGYVVPEETAVVHDEFSDLLPSKLSGDSADLIQFVSYKPDELVYRSKTANERLAVFSEVWYPKGWNAYIDGEKVEHFRANYILRALSIPSGEHEIRFSFEPEIYGKSETVSLISSLLFYGFLLGGIFVLYRRRDES